MKSLFSKWAPLVVILSIFFFQTIHAQVPQGFTYQAVARDATGQLMRNVSLEVKISLKALENEAPEYAELHAVSTNRFGLLNLIIGEGIVLKGTFKEIDWAKNELFLHLEIDETGQGFFREVAVAKLFSVPYALHAGTASETSQPASNRALSDSAWLLTGNNGTSSVFNFIGTTDFEDLVFKTDNTERMRIAAQGGIGIGTASPSVELEVFGSARVGDGSNYTQIDADGDLFFKGSGDYLVGPNRYAFRYSLVEDFGLFFNALTSEYQFMTSGPASIFDIDATNGRLYVYGKAGIGNPAPVAKLDVIGDARIGDGSVDYAQFSSTGDLFFNGNADYLVGGNRYAFRYSANPTFGLFFNSTNGQYEFKNSVGDAAMSVKAFTGETKIMGPVGIGITATPSEQLEVNGAVNIGNTSTTNSGTLRWTGADFEGYDGTAWNSLTTDADADPANEIQDLSLTGDTLKLGNSATTIDLSGYLDNSDNQTLSISNTASNYTIDISGGNNVSFSIDDADNDPLNEIQDIVQFGDIVSLTGGVNLLDLSAYRDTATVQNLSSNRAGEDVTVYISGGTGTTFNIADNDNDPVNELQDLVFAGDSLSITGSSSTVDLSSYNSPPQNLSSSSVINLVTVDISGGTGTTFSIADNDADPTNEMQDLGISSNILSLTGSSSTVDLSNYFDNTDAQNLSSNKTGEDVTVTISGGSATTFNIADGDNDPTNEIQDPIMIGNTLGFTGSSQFVDFTLFMDNTDTQSLSIAGNTLSISNGNAITLPSTSGATGATGPAGLTGATGAIGATGPTR